MPFDYNPHRHIKIWLSHDKDSFLNKENQLRLVYMRHINPNDKIYFIYDRSLLSDKALNQLDIFCKQHQLIAKDVQTDIIPQCSTQEEANLISVYQDNVTHLDQGGNLGAASDVLRWLQPIYELGTYTDLDVTVDTRNMPPSIEVEEPLLINIGSIALKNENWETDYEALCVNNDTLAVIDYDHALPRIKKIQQTIYNASSKNAFQNHCLFNNHENAFALSIKNMILTIVTEKGLTKTEDFLHAEDVLLHQNQQFQSIQLLNSLSYEITARELRHYIMQSTQNNSAFREWIEKYPPYGIRNLIKEDQLNEIHKNKNYCETHREKIQRFLLKNSVVYSTGPLSLLFGMFDTMHHKQELIKKEIVTCSFSYYQLDKVFISNNGQPFHDSVSMIPKKNETQTNKRSSDLSWLKEGQDATREREQIIDSSAMTLQRFFRGNQARNELKDVIDNSNQIGGVNDI